MQKNAVDEFQLLEQRIAWVARNRVQQPRHRVRQKIEQRARRFSAGKFLGLRGAAGCLQSLGQLFRNELVVQSNR